jgi:magnesium transporter
LTKMFGIRKHFKRKGGTSGLAPGTPVYLGDERHEPVRITLIDYDKDHIEEREISTPEECAPLLNTDGVSWLNLDGIHDVGAVETLGRALDLHPLVQEDVVNPWHRPKLEDFESYLFVVLKMLSYDEKSGEVNGEQVSLVLSRKYVISFQERPGDVFDFVRERIRSGKGRIRRMGADYLAYALLDAVVDQYFLILEKIGDRVEDMDDGVVSDPRPEILQEIHSLKREMIFLRKSVWPLREVINRMERGESSLITPPTQKYLRDVYDHTVQVIDTLETFRDMIAGMHDTYLTSISNRMNQVMKVLTIIATIFIPLTFIAGIYGMNFEFMPELKWRWGYAAVWGVMAVSAVIMLLFFRKKRWL